MSSYVVCKTNVSVRQNALECDVRWQWTTFCCAERRLYYVSCIGTGAKVPGSESTRERKFLGTKVPGNESSWERRFQGTKVPGSESSTYGTFALGSESTWERKFHNSLEAPFIEKPFFSPTAHYINQIRVIVQEYYWKRLTGIVRYCMSTMSVGRNVFSRPY